MIIRRFVDTDAPALWRVFFSAVREIACADYSPEQVAVWAPDERDPDAWATRMQGLQPFVACDDDGVPCGYADLQADGYIDHFFVAGWAARRGVGSALMRRLHQEAALRGLTSMYAHVSLTARPFFETFGFEVVDAREVDVRGVRLRNFLMRKSRVEPTP